MKVPFVDLNAQYNRYKSEIDRAIFGTIEEASFIGGAAVSTFETAFSAYTKAEHTVACANGTDSMEMVLQALGIGQGHEVIVPALSWVSTAEVVVSCGATPVFVDIDHSFTIDPTKIEERISDRTRAIIPVHLYGCPSDMGAIKAIADKHNLLIIEDCAQSHGAKFNGTPVSQFGVAGSFSFYPGKNLGAYGDAGAVVTNNTDLAKQVRMMANHGQPRKHEHVIAGRNSRLDGMQAAILNAKLPHLNTWTEERQSNASYYNEKLQDLPITLPLCPAGREHVYHLYVIQSEKRDALMKHLANQNIGVAIHYPVPMPLMPCFSHLGYKKGDFPVTEYACDTILSLPMYPELSKEQIDFVADEISAFYA